MSASEIIIAPFQPADQQEAKALILDGLVGHWGWLDPTKNPDLDDIAASYAGGVFLTARQAGRLVGTGALLPRGEETAEVLRMSVAADVRRQGIGRLILEQLCQRARESGVRRIVLETTHTWREVVAFYLRFGFHITHYTDGDVYFALDL